MLKTTKQTTISGQSIISGKTIAYFSASINKESGSTSINSNVNDQKLYDANKVEVRKDLADFTNAVYEEEDRFASDAETPEQTE